MAERESVTTLKECRGSSCGTAADYCNECPIPKRNDKKIMSESKATKYCQEKDHKFQRSKNWGVCCCEEPPILDRSDKLTPISEQVISTLEASVEDFLSILLKEQEHDDYEPALRVLIWEIVARKAHTYAARFA